MQDEGNNNELDPNLENEEILDEDSNIVTLTDEDGNEVNFEFVDFIEYENENYVILLPADEVEEGDSDEVVILKEDKESQEESYISVDNEETLNKVFEIFKDKFKDEFNFTEGEE